MSKVRTKLKTNSSAKKRFRTTGTGKIAAKSAHRNHILSKIKTAVKRVRRAGKILPKADETLVKRMMRGG